MASKMSKRGIQRETMTSKRFWGIPALDLDSAEGKLKALAGLSLLGFVTYFYMQRNR